MKTTIIFKDGRTVAFQMTYRIYVDTDSLIVNYMCYETLGDTSPSCNTACYDIAEITAVIKGECTLFDFRN